MRVASPRMINNPRRFWRDPHVLGGEVISQVRTVRARERDGSQKSNERKGSAG